MDLFIIVDLLVDLACFNLSGGGGRASEPRESKTQSPLAMALMNVTLKVLGELIDFTTNALTWTS